MPNYARQSSLDLDEMFGNYIKSDSNAAMMRNIRTKEIMNSAHHCEDKECSGSPTWRCVSALHFCWCLAPVIDEDKKSDTYGQVVICGQRFQCISPKGCAVHTYLAGFNLDIKNARNNYPVIEIRWKAIFEAYKSEHDTALANKAERQELLKKRAGMTDHQYRRQLKLQDQAAFKKSLGRERAVDRKDASQEVSHATPTRLRRNDTKEAKRQKASGIRANAMAKLVSEANEEIETKYIAKDEDGMISKMKPKGGKDVRRGKASAKMKTMVRGKTGGYTVG